MAIRRPIWRYGLFQIPATLLAACLIVASVTYVLQPGCLNLWTSLFLGLAWIALMWTLVMPIDYSLRSVLKLGMSLAGRMAIFHAIFWTVLTAAILASVLPNLHSLCVTSELLSLDWSRWRANIWNEMFLESNSSAPIGSEAEFSFVVNKNGQIEEVQISASEPSLESYVRSRIENLEGKKILEFIADTRRDEVLYESTVTICDDSEPSCGDPANPDDYPDTEKYTE